MLKSYNNRLATVDGKKDGKEQAVRLVPYHSMTLQAKNEAN
jgi:hypothetical protein